MSKSNDLIILHLGILFFVIVMLSIFTSITDELNEENRINNLCVEGLGGLMIRGNIFKETKCVIYDNGTIIEIPEYLIQTFHQNR